MALPVRNYLSCLVFCAILGLGACAHAPVSTRAESSDPQAANSQSLSHPEASLAQCDGATVSLLPSSGQLAVLVHGARSQDGLLEPLARSLGRDGRHVLCFQYDPRSRLPQSASVLAASLRALMEHSPRGEILVVGHSLGALVSRNALVQLERPAPTVEKNRLVLVTIAGPFAGIGSASRCTSPAAWWLTLGLSTPICQLIAGDSWRDITHRSAFIRNPGRLPASVALHLKIETDESVNCRALANLACIPEDMVFSLAEQRHPMVDTDSRVRIQTVVAGHSELLDPASAGMTHLLGVMQRHRLLATAPADSITPAATQEPFEAMETSSGQ